MSCISSSMLIRLRCLDRQAVDTLALTKKKIAKRHKKIAKRRNRACVIQNLLH